MKDLVNSPVKKYQDIFDTIAQGSTNSNKYLPNNTVDNDYTNINLLPTENMNSNVSGNHNHNHNNNGMKDELKSFLKKQFNSSNELDQGLSSCSSSSSNFGSPF
jgi:hypothetical protein